MLRIIRNMLLILAIATLLAFLGVTAYSSGRTYSNKENEIGNTLGNIYNGGLFCEQNEKIFFRNDTAGGKLYAMDASCTVFNKIYDDKAAFINADENYLYYVKANDTGENQKDNVLMFNNTGIFRIDRTGRHFKAISGNPASYLMLYGNFLYFQRYDVTNGTSLYRSLIDGTKGRLLYEDAVIPAGVINNTVYYTGNTLDRNINGLDLSSYTSNAKYKVEAKYPIFIGDYIYYINLDDKNNIYRMNLDGTNVQPVIKDYVSTYNITKNGQYLIYQVADGKKNRICRYNLQTLEDETLMKGDYKQIHVTENYIFFKDADNTKTYVIRSDGRADINTFTPPDLDAPPVEE